MSSKIVRRLILIAALSLSACSFEANITKMTKSSSSDNSDNTTPAPPSTISYTLTQSYFKSQNTVTLNPIVSGTAHDFTISPALPAGLSINPTTGTISGTPTQGGLNQAYSILAKDDSGNDLSTTIEFELANYFLVNTVNDTADTNLGDGLCIDGSGNCSVRAALEEAKALGASQLSYIDIPAGTYGVDSLPLSVESRVILKGAGAATTIFDGKKDGTAVPLVILIPSSDDFTLDGITVENGENALNQIITGVGIAGLAKNFALKNCSILNNKVLAPTFVFAAGIGVYNNSGTGEVLIENCLIQGNTQSGGTGLGTNNGAGISVSASKVTINNTSIIGNTFSTATGSSEGGGAYLVAPDIWLDQVIFDSNQARNKAAGLYISGNSQIRNSTFNNDNGAINIFGNEIYIFGTGTHTIENTLINQSTAQNVMQTNGGQSINFINSTANVGGVFLSIKDAQINFNSTTLVRNTNGNVFTFSGSNTTGSISFENSILKLVTGFSYDPGTGNPSYTSLGYNVFSEPAPGSGPAATDLESTDPLLAALSNNGGPTKTMALGAGSAARDRIPVANCLAHDQRGQSRLAGTFCDAGAYQH